MSVNLTIITVVTEKRDIIVVAAELTEINTTVITVITTQEVREDIEIELIFFIFDN